MGWPSHFACAEVVIGNWPVSLFSSMLFSAVDRKAIHLKAASFALLAEKNPFPLLAHAELANGTEGYLSTRIKLGESSVVKVVVKAGGKHHIASREIKVTIGGCGG